MNKEQTAQEILNDLKNNPLKESMTDFIKQTIYNEVYKNE